MSAADQLAEARKALADSAVPAERREWWEAWCSDDHMIASTKHLPAGERERRPDDWPGCFHHCDDCDTSASSLEYIQVDPPPDPLDVSVVHREWDYPAREDEVSRKHLAAALAEVDRLTADLAALRIERGAMCGEIAHIREDLDEARCERDDARDETRCLWDATEADRARMAAIESRPTYEDGVRAGLVAAGRSCRLAEIAMRNRGNVETSAIGARECALIIDEINPADILSLLEPKP